MNMLRRFTSGGPGISASSAVSSSSSSLLLLSSSSLSSATTISAVAFASSMRPPGVSGRPVTPPPLRKLPPAPPLPGARSAAAANSTSPQTEGGAAGDAAAISAANAGLFGGSTFKSPHDVLALFIEFIPTFYVPINSVSSILSDEARDFLKTKGKAITFFRRYRFFFDVRIVDNSRYEIRLREDVQHPRRGSADDKFSLADIGENATYAVLPEYVTSLENIDSRADINVNVAPVLPPPSLHVRLQERVPVMERLKAMIPEDDFVPMEELAERIPEDILTHPYFDSQGGLPAIASKFPDMFQVVEGQIRIRPPGLAPLALDDFTFDNSPEPEIIAIIKKAVCASDIPMWVSLTGLYEQLPLQQRRTVKRGYKSFASFLRAHGKSLALSNDLLKVSHWIPPRTKPPTTKKDQQSIPPAPVVDGQQQQQQQQSSETGAVQFTQLHVLNELYDRFPRGKEMTLHDFLRFVPEHLRGSLPKNAAAWLVNFPQYFVVEGAAATRDPSDIRIRRARDHAPVDIALQLYPLIPDDGIAVLALEQQLPPTLKAHVDQFGIHNIVENLPEWLELLDGDLFRTKSLDELEAAMSKTNNEGAAAAAAPVSEKPVGIAGVRDDKW